MRSFRTRRTYALSLSFPSLLLAILLLSPPLPFSQGSNRLRKADVAKACGPHVSALFLHCASALTPADILALVRSCPNLKVLSLSECSLDDHTLRGIAASACAAASLCAIRLWMCSGEFSAEAVGALVSAAAPRLLWLDLEAAFFGRQSAPDHTPWLRGLANAKALRVAILPSRPPPDALAAAFAPASSAGPIASSLELLSVEGDGGAHTPLSTIEPLVAAGLVHLDLHGLFLDAGASDAACAAVNRLTVRDEPRGTPLPRASLLKCTRLAELRIQCTVTDDDVDECLAKIRPLRSLHLSGAPSDGLDPEVIMSLNSLKHLMCLNLSSCLRNYYEVLPLQHTHPPARARHSLALSRPRTLHPLHSLHTPSASLYRAQYGEEVADENLDALLALSEGCKKLVQLDLSGHCEAFYACVEGRYCPYDSLTTMTCKLSCSGQLRVLNLGDNGRKFGWRSLRRALSCVNRDARSEGEPGVTIRYGDGSTEFGAGVDDVMEGEGEPSDDEGGYGGRDYGGGFGGYDDESDEGSSGSDGW